MREFTRVFGKKTLFLLAMLCIINAGVLILCADSNKAITPVGEELELYLKQYPDFLERTMENSRRMARLNVYQSGFASSRLEQVSEAYASLEGVSVQTGDNRGLVLFIQYRLTDIFQMVFLFSVVMSLFDERKKGLVYIVRSTKHGRGTLFLTRLIILGVASFVGMLFLYGSGFLSVRFTFGVDGLSRSLQSLPEFQKCPYAITIGGYLLCSFFMKLVGSFLAACLLYVVLGIFSRLTSYAMAILLILFEILTALWIESISAWNVLKYLNLYTFMQTDYYFTDCIFLNIFGRAVSGMKATFIACGISFLLLALIGFIVHGKMYVSNKKTLEKLAEIIRKFTERLAPQRTLMGWEVYKLGIKQGAFILLIALFALQLKLAFQYNYYYPVDAMERLSFMEYHGELNEETYEKATWEMGLLEASEARLRDSIASLLSKDSLDTYWYNQYHMALENNLKMQEGLLPVIENIRDGMAYTERTGNTIQVIQPYTYDLLINRDEQTRRRAAFLELIAIIGGVSGVYACEKQNHMNQLIQTSYRGRLITKCGKPIIVACFCALIAVAIHTVQLIHVGSSLGFNDLNTPIQSLAFMREYPLYISIAGYLVLLFSLRALIAIILGLLVAGISKHSADKFTAMGLSVFFCMMLFAISALVPKLSFLNPIYLLSADFLR